MPQSLTYIERIIAADVADACVGEIIHDADCNLLRNGPCSCVPEIILTRAKDRMRFYVDAQGNVTRQDSLN